MVVPVTGEGDSGSSPVRGVMIPGATALSTGDLSSSPVVGSNLMKGSPSSAGISLIDSTESNKNTLGDGGVLLSSNSLEPHLLHIHHDSSSNSESSIIPASSKMDLEQGDKVGLGVTGAEGIISGRMKKYSYSPNDPELPPHLSEYLEQNVIAIMNRCDPERGRRCYSCGYDNTVNSDQQQQQLKQQQEGYGSGYSSAFRNSVGYEDEPYCWNAYSYVNNGSTGAGMGYGYSNQYGNSGGNSQPQGGMVGWNYYNDSYSGHLGLYHNNYQHGNMSEGEIAMALSRRRYNSDGGNSDLDSGNAMDDDEVFTFDVSSNFHVS